MHFVAAILPLLALTSANVHNPPHMRHRRMAAGNQIEANDLHHAQTSPRSNTAHAEAHRVIKRTFNKRGEQCRPRPNPSSSVIAAAQVTSAPAIPNQNALAHDQSATTSSPPPPPPPESTPQNSNNNNNNNNNGGQPASGGNGPLQGGLFGLLNFNDNSCGWCQSSADSPNGAEWWLNCGLNDGGWRPPHVGMHDLVAAPLTADGIFAPCAPYIDKFYQYAGEFGVHPIMLASFAMQESTCNPGATGGSGEAGLMQISPPNCNNQYGSCWDVDYNIRRGAELFSQMINDKGGNVLAAIGAYNGWRVGMTAEDGMAAKWRGACFQQNNLDYIHQYVNGWMQGKSGYALGTYFNLRDC